jgi:putative thioredoxin
MTVTTPNIVEVTDEDFERVVVEGSRTRPVVVDLWAEWCAPCRTLGPTLEKVAAEREGAFLLAKLDVDSNQVGNALLQAVRSQGIPTVVAFRDGEPVSMFIGAYPESEVNTFIDQLLPTEAELVAEEASAEEASGDLAGAEEGYRGALEKDPTSRDASVGLARILADRGELDAARELIGPHLPDVEAERVASSIRVREWAGIQGETALDEAKRRAASGAMRDALEGMLAAIVEDRDAARQAMVDVFAVLGDEDPLVIEYRRKLTNALY